MFFRHVAAKSWALCKLCVTKLASERVIIQLIGYLISVRRLLGYVRFLTPFLFGFQILSFCAFLWICFCLLLNRFLSNFFFLLWSLWNPLCLTSWFFEAWGTTFLFFNDSLLVLLLIEHLNTIALLIIQVIKSVTYLIYQSSTVSWASALIQVTLPASLYCLIWLLWIL